MNGLGSHYLLRCASTAITKGHKGQILKPCDGQAYTPQYLTTTPPSNIIDPYISTR